MVIYLIEWAYMICKKNESIPREEKKIWQKVWYNGLKLVGTILIEWILKLKYTVTKEPVVSLVDDRVRPIVSLTSFPARINSVWLVIHTMFTQTYKPGKIILVLTKSEFPKGIEEVPLSLKKFMDKGLEIIFTDENLRPHNKYYYALSTYTDRNIITIDDDQLYWPDTIDRLVKLSVEHPKCVCANAVSYIDINQRKVVGSFEVRENVRYTNLGLGVCGVLYPTNFRSAELFNISNIQQLSFTADDLWLKAQEILLGIPVVTGDKYEYPLPIIGSQKIKLMEDNVDNGANDLQWKQLDKYYDLTNLLGVKLKP